MADHSDFRSKPIADISQVIDLPNGEIGEFIVRGPVVSDRYLTRPEANALHKIADDLTVWHRMGDVGYLDAESILVLRRQVAPRANEQGTLFTIPCEAIFNQHASIYRCAFGRSWLPRCRLPE